VGRDERRLGRKARRLEGVDAALGVVRDDDSVPGVKADDVARGDPLDALPVVRDADRENLLPAQNTP
jgi:hypothetical protein